MIIENIRVAGDVTITFDPYYVEMHYEDFMDEDMACLTMTREEAIELRDKLEEALNG